MQKRIGLLIVGMLLILSACKGDNDSSKEAQTQTVIAEDNRDKNDETLYVINCNESITLRNAPSTSGEEICQIPLGAAVKKVETSQDGFYKVDYLGNIGYAQSSYLGSEIQTLTTMYETMEVVNCEESITLRTSPNIEAEEICQIPLGAVVSYTETAVNGFYKISYLGNTGYALASYLRSK